MNGISVIALAVVDICITMYKYFITSVKCWAAAISFCVSATATGMNSSPESVLAAMRCYLVNIFVRNNVITISQY